MYVWELLCEQLCPVIKMLTDMCYIVIGSKQRVNLSLGALSSSLSADEECHLCTVNVGIDLVVYNCDMNCSTCL